jgi:hypothetical protein
MSQMVGLVLRVQAQRGLRQGVYGDKPHPWVAPAPRWRQRAQGRVWRMPRLRRRAQGASTSAACLDGTRSPAVLAGAAVRCTVSCCARALAPAVCAGGRTGMLAAEAGRSHWRLRRSCGVQLELAGCWLIQGQELPEAFTGVDDHELWDWQRADLADPATRATVGDFWCRPLQSPHLPPPHRPASSRQQFEMHATMSRAGKGKRAAASVRSACGVPASSTSRPMLAGQASKRAVTGQLRAGRLPFRGSREWICPSGPRTRKRKCGGGQVLAGPIRGLMPGTPKFTLVSPTNTTRLPDHGQLPTPPRSQVYKYSAGAARSSKRAGNLPPGHRLRTSAKGTSAPSARAVGTAPRRELLKHI